MSKWFYYNENGDKVEVTGGQLKGLAKAGIITPGTLVETEEGKKAPAKHVKGLTFLTATPSAVEASKPTAPVEINPLPVEINPFTIPLQEETNPFLAEYSPNQTTSSSSSSFTSTASAQSKILQSDVQKFIALITTPATTKAESKQKGKIFGMTCLFSLLPLIIFLLPCVNMLLEGRSIDDCWTNSSVFRTSIIISIPVVLITLISFCLWLNELANQGSACPRCDKVNTRETLSHEDINVRHITEREEVTRLDADGKTIRTGQYKDVQKTKYDTVWHYRCKSCNHEWEETIKNLTKDGWV